MRFSLCLVIVVCHVLGPALIAQNIGFDAASLMAAPADLHGNGKQRWHRHSTSRVGGAALEQPFLFDVWESHMSRTLRYLSLNEECMLAICLLGCCRFVASRFALVVVCRGHVFCTTTRSFTSHHYRCPP